MAYSASEGYESSYGDEESFKGIIEAIADPIAIFDRDLRYVYINPVIEKYAGIPRDEFIGKRIDELGMPPETVAMWSEVLVDVFQNGTDRWMQFEFPTSMGVRTFQSHSSPQFSTSGDVRRVVTVSRDITDLKRVEGALIENEWFLEKAQEVAHIGSWISDPGVTGKLRWSKEIYKMFGVEEGDFDGRIETFFSYVHPDDIETVRRVGEAALDGRGIFDIDHRIIRPNGEVRISQTDFQNSTASPDQRAP